MRDEVDSGLGLVALDADESKGASDEGQRPKPLTTLVVC